MVLSTHVVTGVHTRLLVAVGSAVWYVVPRVQAVMGEQIALLDGVGCVEMYSLPAHVFTLMHWVWPALGWKVPGSQVLHTGRDVMVAGLVWRVPGAQGTTGLQAGRFDTSA